MNLIEQVEHLLATYSKEQKESLYRASNFDFFQKEGCDVLLPESALQLAQAVSYESELVNPPEAKPKAAWEIPSHSVSAAGNFEEMPLAA